MLILLPYHCAITGEPSQLDLGVLRDIGGQKSFGLAGGMMRGEWHEKPATSQCDSLVRPYFMESVDLRPDNWVIEGSWGHDAARNLLA